MSPIPWTSRLSHRLARSPKSDAKQRTGVLVMAIVMANVTDLETQQGQDSMDDTRSGSSGDLLGGRNIDKARSRYPYCIVWTPLPIITWFLPLIGELV